MYPQLRDDDTLQALFNDLSGVIQDPDRLSTSQEQLEAHASSKLSLFQGKPANILAFPNSTAEVSAIVKTASKHGVPVIPYGGGTSLEGGNGAPFGGLCIDLKNMAKMIETRPMDLDVTVQPGIVWTDLNQQLAPHNLFFPIDPGFGATVGGMISTGASGTNAARYGTIKDGWILGLVVVLADGTIVRTKGRAKKSSSGYDLTRLMIGSEGTLGIVTEATLRVTSIPRYSNVVTCAFDSLDEIVSVATQILLRNLSFQCIEYVDEVFMATFDQHQVKTDPTAPRFEHKPHIFVKLSNTTQRGLDEDAATLKMLCSPGSDFRLAQSPKEAETLWTVRKEITLIFGTSERTEKEPAAISTDVCVPRSALAEIARYHRADIDSRPRLRAALLGHVGDGNIHSLILFDRTDAAAVQAADEVHKNLIKKSLAVEGTISGEHGVGSAKAEFLESEHGGRLIQVMKGIKAVLDPKSILNPGQLFMPGTGNTQTNRGIQESKEDETWFVPGTL